MRLIDKDGLLELIKDLEVTYQEDLDRFKDEELRNPQRYRDTQRGRIEGVIACSIDVYTAEEVEAIPIEWMKSWAMKNWVKTKKCEFDIIVSKLIDEWLEERCREKENETN